VGRGKRKMVQCLLLLITIFIIIPLNFAAVHLLGPTVAPNLLYAKGKGKKKHLK